MTRAASIGVGIGITTSNEVWFGGTTAGGATAVLTGTAWFKFTSSNAYFNGSLGVATASVNASLQVGSSISNTGTQTVRIVTPYTLTNVVDALHIDHSGSGAYTEGVAISIGYKDATYNSFTSRIVNYTNIGVTQATKLQLQTQAGGGTTWNTGILIGDTGLVGINTVSPSYNLHVVGDSYVASGSLGVNVAPNATDGRIDASNDIVAYSSDRRLKTNVKLIENPIDKIKKIDGFIFNWNEKANQLAGYNKDISVSGVYAQQVQEVLPEAVKLAPFDNDGNDNSISGENYLTVQYEKLVPLLIEAIKEQQKEIEKLKDRL
jgi:hypothetical protein